MPLENAGCFTQLRQDEIRKHTTVAEWLEEHRGHMLYCSGVQNDHGCPIVFRMCLSCSVLVPGVAQQVRISVSHKDETEPLLQGVKH